MTQQLGVVAFLFTDLVGSTELLDRLGDDAAEAVRRTHFSLLRQALASTGGREVKTMGDGLMAAFQSPAEAVACAVAMQQAVEDDNRDRPEAALGLRIGLHVGEPVREEDDYFGTAVVVAKRLCDRAAGGEILASELLRTLVGTRGGFRFEPAGRLSLKGLAEPVPAVTVDWRPPSARPVAQAAPRPSADPPPRGPRLVGRDGEMAALEAAMTRSVGGEFRCVLLVGDPGVGKSRLAAEFLYRHRNWTTSLAARAYPLGGTAPFGLWAEALERHLRGLPPNEVTDLAGAYVDDLSTLLRSVAAVRGAVDDREAPRIRILEGLAELAANLAVRAPVVAFLDDMHLADASSWQALAYLAHQITDARFLVIVSARSAELADEPVAQEILLDLEQEQLLERLPVTPLPRPVMGDLAAAVLPGTTVPAALVDWVADRSLGNPLFAVGLLQALQDEGADLAAPQLRSLPEGLADRVLGRLRLLDEPSRTTMEILALVGRRVELGELVTLSGRDLDELAEVLERLVRFRLVAEEERGRELVYDIAHPLVQETVYQAIGGARRRTLHRSAGRALRASGRLGEAASHFARSAHVGDDEAIEVLLEAVRQADKREAYAEALAMLTCLVEVIPRGDERWHDVYEAMTWQAEWLVDHRAGLHAPMVIQALREIDALLARSGELARQAGVKLRMASFLTWGTGELDEAERAVREAMELFEQAGDHPTALLAANELGAIRGLRGELTAWENASRHVLESAGPDAPPFLVREAVAGVAWAAFWGGRLDVADAAFDRLLATARQDRNPYRLIWALASLALTHAVAGRTAEALPLLEEARAVSPKWRETMLLEQETCIHWLAGNFDAALTAAREAARQNRTGVPTRRRGIGMGIGALAALETGRMDEARQFLDQARLVCGDRDWLIYNDHCSYVEGILAWREGRLADALARLREVFSKISASEARPFHALMLLEYAEVAAVARAADVAATAAARLGQIADYVDRDVYRGLASMGTAWAALAADNPKAASDAASEAVWFLSRTGARGFLGRAYDVLGRSLTSLDAAAARRAFDQAVETLEACGAVWARDRAMTARDQLDNGGPETRLTG